MANTSSSQRMTTICQRFASSFASHGEQESKISLPQYAMSARQRDTSNTSQSRGPISRVNRNTAAQSATMQQFYRLALTMILFAAVIAGIIALKSAIWIPALGR